ncbi:MAG: ATP-dependent Zn protease [Leptolyngbyaceae bacterium]|nr:ATP-dependent Zn protease [Leptolyngbyaceae bacterium]
MSQTALNLVAISIFVLTLSTLLGPLFNLSSAVPALAAFTLLGLATLDTLSWRGQGGTLLLDWLASISPKHRERVIHHEAGHFLVAYVLGIPVTSYTLTAWEAFRQGQPGLGGVTFDTQSLETQATGNQALLTPLLEKYFTVWMAGAVAETLVYGKAEGGADDRNKFRLLWSQLRRPSVEGEQKERWATQQSKQLLQQNWPAYEALVHALEQRASIAECYQLLDQHCGQNY